MKRAPRAFFVVLVAAACSGDEPPTGRALLPVINGTFDTGDSSVVALTGQDGSPFCSGTLVSPEVVLTAAHCVADVAPTYIYVGSAPATEGFYLHPSKSIPHPAWNPATLDNDIGAVILADPLPKGVTIATMSEDAPTPGEPLRFVGFGFTQINSQGEYGKKFQGTAPVTTVDTRTLSYGVATCNGDSGGPAFVAEGAGEAVEGITSFGDSACAKDGTDTRVDAYRAFIDPIVAAHRGPPDAGMNLDDHDWDDCAIAVARRGAGGAGAAGGGAGGALAATGAALVRRRKRARR